ncbi:hypothetical protein ACNVED_12835 [Legionella sp. D16C41]|uniref:hypothetical protein n=1 Tax=Legionella sp. D16C41 TaxID=3402688 RepID=UPI003AF8352A
MTETTDSLNKDIFNYKCWFITAILIVGYTYMHVQLTGLYDGVPLESWLNFTAPLPFGQRQLVPFLARCLYKSTTLKPYEIFFILEFIFVVFTFFALQTLLQLEFGEQLALLLTWLFFLLLPLCTIINYRFVIDGQAAIFWPYDTPSLFFIILSFYLTLKEKWLWLAVCIFFATLNRESSILLVLLIPALYLRSLKNFYKLILPFLLSLSAYILARLGTYLLAVNLAGAYTEWYHGSAITNFAINMYWLFAKQGILMFIFAFAGLPLLWFGFYDYIPLKYRPIRYLTFLYFLGLLGVGLVAEARIFAEIVALIYLPVCLAITNWLQGKQIVETQPKRFMYYLNRYLIVLLLILIPMSSKFIDYTIKQWIPVSSE